MIKYIAHTADAGLEVESDSIEQALAESAMGLAELVYDVPAVSPDTAQDICVTSPDTDILLHDWLAEILQKIIYEKFLIARIEDIMVSQEKHNWRVEAKILGQNFDRTKHKYKSDVKAVTYHMLKLQYENGKWVGSVIFDL